MGEMSKSGRKSVVYPALFMREIISFFAIINIMIFTSKVLQRILSFTNIFRTCYPVRLSIGT